MYKEKKKTQNKQQKHKESYCSRFLDVRQNFDTEPDGLKCGSDRQMN